MGRWNVEYTDEFCEWWESLDENEQVSVAAGIELLSEQGPQLSRPHVDTLKSSKHTNMKELRVQHEGNPYRTFFAFDPRRTAILLIGGNKRGDDLFYERLVPIADRLYDEYLKELEDEGIV